MNPDSQDKDFIEFEDHMEKVLALIQNLPRGFMSDQCKVKANELCYWFSEARIDAMAFPEDADAT